MIKVAYITFPFFLDTCVERIKELSKEVDLYVYVIITPHGLKSFIGEFSIKHSKKKLLYNIEEIADPKDVKVVNPYFENCKSVKFVMMPPKSFNFKAFWWMSKFKKVLRQLSPNIIHLQEPTVIFWSMGWFFKKYPTIMSVHDPQPHTGEISWRKALIKKILFSVVDSFELYSQYATVQFLETYGTKARILSSSLLPYTIYQRFLRIKIDLPIENERDKIILFYGRISKYKGVEFLMEAFRQLQSKSQNVKLIVAGKSNYDLQIPMSCKELIGKSIFIIDRYIQNGEVTYLMEKSDILVCPYSDATQSGIIMTAIPFGIPLIVSNKGALPEQIEQYKCGVVLKDYNTETLTKELLNSLSKKQQIDSSALVDEVILKIINEYKYLTKENYKTHLK